MAAAHSEHAAAEAWEQDFASWELDFAPLSGNTHLYEVVMRYPERTRMRLTDQVPQIGDTIRAYGLSWEVVCVDREPDTVRGTARFHCDLAVSRRRRAVVVQAEHGFGRRLGSMIERLR